MLEALVSDPYQPPKHSAQWALSLKTALLLFLTSAKRVCELIALSVNPCCLLLRDDHSGMTLRPNPFFAVDHALSIHMVLPLGHVGLLHRESVLVGVTQDW